MSAIAAAQGAACVADPGDQLAVARRVRLALRNGAIEHARLSHLQRLLRLPGLAGDKRGTGGSQVILRRRILADPRARQGRGDPGSRIARHDIAGLVAGRDARHAVSRCGKMCPPGRGNGSAPVHRLPEM